MTEHKPGLALWVLKKIVRSRDYDPALGDFLEIYQEIEERQGRRRARRWLYREVLRSIPGFIRNVVSWNGAMFKNYFRMTRRNMLRNRIFSTVNLLGLAVGMACFIVIMLWVQDESRFDEFQKNKDRLFLLTIHHPSGIEDSNVPYALAPTLARRFPEFADYTRVYELGETMTCSFSALLPNRAPAKFYEKNVCLVDRGFFSMFSFPFRYGNPETALQNPGSVVITDKMAVKYFGPENPLGRKLTLNNKQDLEVTGVVHVPADSSVQFDFVAPLRNPMLDNWNWADPSYVLLDPVASVAEVRTKISASLNEHYPDPISGQFRVDLLPLTQVHLHFGRGVYVQVFSLVAVFILLIACINYMNLSTARSSTRAREVGIRKAVGAKRHHLLFQFLGESVLMSSFGLALALVFAKAFLPILNRLTSKALTFSLLQSPWMIPSLLGLALLAGVLAGIYPALILSASDPGSVLKTAQPFRGRRSVFREMTVIGQFAISVLLIACTFVVYGQVRYFRNRPLGFSADHVVSIPFNDSLKNRYLSFKSDLLQNANVISVTASQAVPSRDDCKTSGLDWPGKDPDLVPSFQYTIAHLDYFETFGMEIVEGRGFSREYQADRFNFLVNETAVRAMGLKNPVGQPLGFWGNRGTIIGVVKDFHHNSLRREILPQVFTILPRYFQTLNVVSVKIGSANVPDTLRAIQASVERFAPEYPFDYQFLDEGIKNLYLNEQKLARMFAGFAVLAIFISCLGIFGLSAFAAERRTKEIGVRKVMGASAPGIMILISREFTKWLAAANILAWPVGWYAMSKWLQSFAYRTSLNPGLFLLAGLLAGFIASVPVTYHALRAARSNPVDALRYE